MQNPDLEELNRHQTVMDNDEQQVGRLYGRSFLGAAGDRADEALEELQAVAEQCMTAQPQLAQLLRSPRVGQDQKEQLIDRIFRGRVDPLVLNFLKVLCRRNRIGSLKFIQLAAAELRNEAMGRTQVLVTSAQPLSDDQRQAISSRMSEFLGKEVVMREKVDASLLGGIVIRVGDQVFDGSVAGKFASLRGTVLTGIQRAIRDRQSSLMST
jgi:F-type H+-transporting ATPase subunit delta